MSLAALDNLVRIGQLKAEPRNVAEVGRMLSMARTSLADAQLSTLSPQGRFTSAYNAAHAAALTALRWHGSPIVRPRRIQTKRLPGGERNTVMLSSQLPGLFLKPPALLNKRNLRIVNR